MDQYWYCGVLVKGAKSKYSYISDTGEIPLDTYVMVPFGRYNALRVGIVKSCAEYSAQNAPYPVHMTKHIVRQATAEEYNNQPPLPPFHNSDDTEYDWEEINYYIEIEDWEDVFEWACDNHDDSDEHTARKVMECYELCVKHDMPEAALNLGTFYFAGRFVKQDYQKAYELYKKAADAGILDAIYYCGYFFYYGFHQEIDYEKAYEYFSLGAMLYNDTRCLCKLGDMYLNGYHKAKNKRYAFILYQNALRCIQEKKTQAAYLPDVQFRIGKCYLYGVGTYKDIEKAHELLSLALVNFYKKRKTDHFVIESIQAVKKLLAQAQDILERETSNYQRKPDILLESSPL